jgi:hypothetical protein
MLNLIKATNVLSGWRQLASWQYAEEVVELKWLAKQLE